MDTELLLKEVAALRKTATALILCVLMLWVMGLNGICAQENLLKNGDFERVSGTQPEDWNRGMWVTTIGASYLESADDAYAGDHSVLVENVQDNDARFEQTVTVKPETYYRLSAYVKAEDIPTTGVRGANISFADIYETSESVYDTNGEWVQLELYARTGKGQKSVTVMARVGGYSAITSGRAWFDDIRLEQVDAVPAGHSYLDLSTPAPPKAQSSAVKEETDAPGLQHILLLVAAGVVFALVLPWRRTQDEKPQTDKKYTPYLAAVLAGAFLLRAVLAMLVPGYEVDMNCFASWSGTMFSAGPSQFYQSTSFCDYPPAYLYVLWFNGLLMKVLGTGYSGAAFMLVIKLVPMLLDMVCAALIYGLAKKHAGEKKAFSMAAIYALCPAPIIVSACWGQIDAALITLLIIVLLAASQARFDIALPVYFLAILTKPQALLLAPLGICALIVSYLNQKEKAQRTLLTRRIGVGVIASLVTVLVIVTPFSIHQEATWLFEKYAETLSSYNYATLSTGNVMFLLEGNWKSADLASPLGISYTALGWTLMIASIAFVVFLAIRSRKLSMLFELSALELMLICTTGVKMHERYMLPVLALLLAAFVLRSDWRTLAAFALCAFTLTVNCGVVLLFEHLIYPNEWAGYLCGAANVLACALMGWAAWDHAVRERVWALPVQKEKAIGETAGESEFDARIRRELTEGMDAKLRMRVRDWILVGAVTAAYAIVAFINLGVTDAPETAYVSTSAKESVTIDLGAVQEDFNIYYYGGISDVEFSFAVSEDGVNWTEDQLAEFNVGVCFRWLAHRAPLRNADGTVRVNSNGDAQFASQMEAFTGRYVRVTFVGAGAQLWEVACVKDGKTLAAVSASASGAVESRASVPVKLIDEQNTAPDVPSYLTGTYFDEIYHARTAYEHIHGISPYETTHPPLGKLLIALGVLMFGMNPFGWRFMGTLFGVLMLPVMYLLGKQLFKGRTLPSFLCTALMALDCMHFTQTRIATIDTYPVFFIMAMFLCMLCWTRMNFMRDSLLRTLVPLFLSGLFMGCAIASKWTGIYAAAGLAVFFFWRLYGLWRQGMWAKAHAQEDVRFAQAAKRFNRACIVTLACCCVFFVLIPLLIYCASYIPHLAPGGRVTIRRIWHAQEVMFSYHSDLTDDHFFQSPWWQWPLIIKPMWYYAGSFLPEGKISTILSFGNPAVWWTGLAALLYVMMRAAFNRGVPAITQRNLVRDDLDDNLAFLIFGFLAQYLPWVLVPRSTFIYHYFASVPFIILAVGQCFEYLARRDKRAAYIAAGALGGAAFALFVGFYPLASGALVPEAWGDAMNWFGSWMYY